MSSSVEEEAEVVTPDASPIAPTTPSVVDAQHSRDESEEEEEDEDEKEEAENIQDGARSLELPRGEGPPTEQAGVSRGRSLELPNTAAAAPAAASKKTGRARGWSLNFWSKKEEKSSPTKSILSSFGFLAGSGEDSGDSKRYPTVSASDAAGASDPTPSQPPPPQY